MVEVCKWIYLIPFDLKKKYYLINYYLIKRYYVFLIMLKPYCTINISEILNSNKIYLNNTHIKLLTQSHKIN